MCCWLSLTDLPSLPSYAAHLHRRASSPPPQTRSPTSCVTRSSWCTSTGTAQGSSSQHTAAQHTAPAPQQSPLRACHQGRRSLSTSGCMTMPSVNGPYCTAVWPRWSPSCSYCCCSTCSRRHECMMHGTAFAWCEAGNEPMMMVT